MEKKIVMSEAATKEIDCFVENGGKLLFYGVSNDGDECLVVEHGGLALVLRNQGYHGRKFYLVKMCEAQKALEIAKRHCA